MNDRVAGMSCLKQDSSRSLSASGAARNLKDELGGAFGSSKITAEQTAIYIDDTHQSDIGKMVAFGQHLSADQNVCLPGMNGLEAGFQFALSARGVSINPSGRGGGEKPCKRLFDALGSKAEQEKFVTPA